MTFPYVQGNIYQSQATFSVNGVPTDPTDIYFIYQVGNLPSTKVQLQYDDATEPSPGVIARTGTGIYVVQVDLTDITQNIVREWVSTGNAQAASGPPFSIAITELPLGLPTS